MKGVFSPMYIHLKYFHLFHHHLLFNSEAVLTWCLDVLSHHFFSLPSFLLTPLCHVLINNQLELLRPSLKSLLFAIYYHPASITHSHLHFVFPSYIILYYYYCSISLFSLNSSKKSTIQNHCIRKL